MEGSLHCDGIKSEFISTVLHMSRPSNHGHDSNAQSTPLNMSLCLYISSLCFQSSHCFLLWFFSQHFSPCSPYMEVSCQQNLSASLKAKSIRIGFSSVSLTGIRRPKKGQFLDRGCIHLRSQLKDVDMAYSMRAAERWKNKVDLCFRRR